VSSLFLGRCGIIFENFCFMIFCLISRMLTVLVVCTVLFCERCSFPYRHADRRFLHHTLISHQHFQYLHTILLCTIMGKLHLSLKAVYIRVYLLVYCAERKHAIWSFIIFEHTVCNVNSKFSYRSFRTYVEDILSNFAISISSKPIPCSLFAVINVSARK